MTLKAGGAGFVEDLAYFADVLRPLLIGKWRRPVMSDWGVSCWFGWLLGLHVRAWIVRFAIGRTSRIRMLLVVWPKPLTGLGIVAGFALSAGQIVWRGVG
jgi:hypothetical protein